MRTYLLLLSAFLLILSCSDSNFKEVHPSVAEYLKKNMHDPSSFQYVDASDLLLDGIIVRMYMDNADRALKYEAYDKPYLKAELDKIFSLDSTYGHIYVLTYRANNSFGALVKSTRRFVIGNDDILYGLADDDGEGTNKLYKAIVAPKIQELRNKMK